MSDYFVTYIEYMDTTEAAHNSLMALNESEEKATLQEVVENCQSLSVSAELYDAAGFRRGWVSQEGSYRLQ